MCVIRKVIKMLFSQEELEDTKRVIRIRKSMNRQHNGQKNRQTQWPKGQTTQWPKRQTTQWPKEQTTQWPKGQTTQWPKGQTTQWPKERDKWTNNYLQNIHIKRETRTRLKPRVNSCDPEVPSPLVTSVVLL